MPPSFTLRRVFPERANAVHAFHVKSLGKHIYPRTVEYLRQLAEEECLFEGVTPAGDVAAIAYVKPGERDIELGGIYLDPAFRGTGLSDALVKVAIAAHFATTPPATDERLIAHVHESNAGPRSLLGRNGFVLTAEKLSLPDDEAPPEMERNADGVVVGDVFDFDMVECAKIADWLEGFQGCCSGTKGGVQISIATSFYVNEDERTALLTVLREIADGFRAPSSTT